MTMDSTRISPDLSCVSLRKTRFRDGKFRLVDASSDKKRVREVVQEGHEGKCRGKKEGKERRAGEWEADGRTGKGRRNKIHLAKLNRV